MASLFTNATALPAAKKAAKSKKDEIAMTGLQQFAELSALQTSIGALLETMAQDIKGKAFDIFMETAEATHKAPSSFDGIEGTATVNIQMKKRSTVSALSESEQAALQAAGIPMHEEVAVHQLFAINPAYATDSKLLDRVSTAIQHIVPADFIVAQEKKAKIVVAPETIEAVFKAPSIDAELVRIVTTMALKPKLSSVDIEAILEDVRELLGTSLTEAAA